MRTARMIIGKYDIQFVSLGGFSYGLPSEIDFLHMHKSAEKKQNARK